MLKVDLHTHTSDDPSDYIPYTSRDLIDRASAQGFHAVAITLHDRQLEIEHLNEYARARRLTLVPGVERTIDGRHVLLLNFPREAELIASFDDLAQLKTRYPLGLVVAPHPFFPHLNCLRGLLRRHAALFDAVEVNAFYTKRFDFNGAAREWARANGKPVIGNSDAHRLSMLGQTFSRVDAPATAEGICSAIKHGRVSVETRPLSNVDAATYFARLAFAGIRRSRAQAQTPLPREAASALRPSRVPAPDPTE
jgi:predicted metal-dependent phosphoesterase TrpH